MVSEEAKLETEVLKRRYFKKYNAARAEKQRLYMKRYYREHPEKYSTKVTLDARLRHYYRDRERLLAHRRVVMAERQEVVNEIKSAPCTDCGRTYPPYVMDLDHARGKKSFNVSRGVCRALKTLLEEIAKCDVVCANCHRQRTYRRLMESKKT